MNKIFKGLFYFSVLMLFASCTTTRFEPKDAGDCLIIGRLEVECEGWNEEEGMLDIDGVYKRGASISLTDATTGKTFTTKTVGYDGLFMFGNLELNRRYYISQVQVKIETQRGAWSSVTSDLGDYGKVNFFTVAEPSKVKIIGDFTALQKKDTPFFMRDKGTAIEVYETFANHYKESAWIDKPFKYKNQLLTGNLSEKEFVEYEQEEVSEDEYDDFLKELMGE